MNTELLKEVAKELQRTPDIYDQETFGTMDGGSCGTKCCIAGLTVLLSDPMFYLKAAVRGGSMNATYSVSKRARKLLRLSKRQAHALFSSSDLWPEPFRSDYERAEGDERAMMRVGVRRIAYFIKTGGK